jgi:hypothetical protein
MNPAILVLALGIALHPAQGNPSCDTQRLDQASIAAVCGGAATAAGGGIAVAMAIIGALLLLGAVALIRKGMRNKDRIIFDRATETVSFDMTRAQDNVTVPFREIGRIELRLEDRSEFEKCCIMYVVNIVRKDDKALKVDEATNRKQMTELAAKAAAVCRVPFRDFVMTEVAA